jgi:hypothetical protein
MNSSSSASTTSKLADTQNKDPIDDVITINEKVNLTKQQHQVLKIICDTYEISLSEYMQQALVEAMRFDIEGNFSDALLENIDGEDSKKDNASSSSPSPNLMKSNLHSLKKLQTQV